MLVRPSNVSGPLRLACERIYNEPHSESHTSEITSLSQSQRKAVLEALKTCNPSTPDQRKRLVEEIKEDPRITTIVHLAIASSSDDLDNDYRAFDKELTQSLLDELEVVAKIEDSNTRANTIDAWLTQYHSHFDQKILEALETNELYRLTSRLIQCGCPELPAYKAIFQNLTEAGKEYAELLQLPLADIKVAIVDRSSDFIPVAHTCFFTIDLSATCPNQETFNEKIKLLLTEGMEKGGFQIA